MLSKSSDGGKTFSHPRLILPMDFGGVPTGDSLMSKVGRVYSSQLGSIPI